MKITVDNWKNAEQAIRTVGVKDTIYEPYGVITTIILKSGDRYELTRDVLQHLMNLGLIDVKLGRRVDPTTR